MLNNWKLKKSFGWFSGETFVLFDLTILERFPCDYITIINIKFLKFSIGLFLERE